MRKTIVLIGEFFGELNAIKDALRRISPDMRCISFTNRDTGVNLLMKDHVLKTDFIIVDDLMPSSRLPLLKTIERPDRAGDAALILFSKRANAIAPHPALRVHSFQKSSNKKDYLDFLQSVIAPENITIASAQVFQ